MSETGSQWLASWTQEEDPCLGPRLFLNVARIQPSTLSAFFSCLSDLYLGGGQRSNPLRRPRSQAASWTLSRQCRKKLERHRLS